MVNWEKSPSIILGLGMDFDGIEFGKYCLSHLNLNIDIGLV